MDKIAALKEILVHSPKDAFARYGLAMAYASEGDTSAALAEFERLTGEHPEYVPGYFMAAQTLAKTDRNDEAKARLRDGIAAAERSGDQHAVGEMQQMLDELDGV